MVGLECNREGNNSTVPVTKQPLHTPLWGLYSDTSTVFGNRIVVDLVKSDGRWLVDDIRAL